MVNVAWRLMGITAIALAVGITSQVDQAKAASAKTAQGIWVSFADQSHALVDETRHYSFNSGAASLYFVNVWDGYPPVVNCSGSPTACANPALAAPPPPAPDASKVTHPGIGAAALNKCTFLDGGTPTGSTYFPDCPAGPFRIRFQ